MAEDLERERARHALYASYLVEFNRREATSSDNYDKAIMGYATGSLALSITFTSSFIKNMADAQITFALKLAWIFWVVSLLITIGSFLVSIKAGRREADKAMRYYAKDCQVALQEPNIWGSILPWFNLGAGLCFSAGVASMMIFVWFNV